MSVVLALGLWLVVTALAPWLGLTFAASQIFGVPLALLAGFAWERRHARRCDDDDDDYDYV